MNGRMNERLANAKQTYTNSVVCTWTALFSAGLTMWQMWQMPRASGLRGASGSREFFSARQ